MHYTRHILLNYINSVLININYKTVYILPLTGLGARSEGKNRPTKYGFRKMLKNREGKWVTIDKIKA